VVSLVCPDTGETQSQAFWTQAYYWLTGGIGTAPASTTSSEALRTATPAATTPSPGLNLSGYTQVAASNVVFLPTTGSVLTINSITNITASSSTKTITEVLLLQTVTDPTDTAFLFATQSPFSIPFTPTRLGTASFGAIAVFSDNTYATATLNYTLQPSGSPVALNLLNAPVANMTVGASRVIQAQALFSNGPVDVTQIATYTAGSGTANVFNVSPGGTITATGNGLGTLNVSYGGVTATAPIAVGACTYALTPSNQIVLNTGGTATIQVATQLGCAWTAGGGAAWLAFANASGTGNGTITVNATANTTGTTQTAFVTLGGLDVGVIQPATACTYGLSQTQINAPTLGASGTITVTTSCPVIASSNQSWVTITPLASSVAYTVAPNNGSSQQTATLTIGTQLVSVTQAGTAALPAPALASPANGAAGVSLTSTLSWSASSGATSYDVYFGTSPTPALLANTMATSYTPATLTSNTAYHWQVVAENSAGTASSAIFSFTTFNSSCSFAATPPAVLIGHAGGSSTVSLTAGTGCAWTAISSASWLTITAGGSGTGNGTISFTVGSNPSAAQLGYLKFANQTVSVMQGGSPSTQIFNDVPPSDPYFDYVSLMSTHGITAGCQTSPPLYCPNTPVTRAQMAVFVVAGLDLALGTSLTYPPSAYFQDVPSTGVPDSIYFPFVQRIDQLGITAGCQASPALYCPDESITQGQMAVFMIVGWMLANNLTTFTYPPTPYFTDVPPTDIFFKFVQKMAQLGFSTGCGGGSYCESSAVTRDQMAPMIIRAVLGAP
jgi:hypothetical protein